MATTKTAESGPIARRRSRDGDRAFPTISVESPSTATTTAASNAALSTSPVDDDVSTSCSPLSGHEPAHLLNGPPTGSDRERRRFAAHVTPNASTTTRKNRSSSREPSRPRGYVRKTYERNVMQTTQTVIPRANHTGSLDAFPSVSAYRYET